MVHAKDLPDFKDMPPVAGMPVGCAWGLFDVDGKRDNLGCLNLLTPEVVLIAKDEIKTGKSVALNWDFHAVEHPGFGRRKIEHTFIDLKPLGFIAHDDEIHINTQSGSQWDGFKHWGHQELGLYYNNLKHEDVIGTTDNGIHHWSDRGGIVGRGVLLDYVAWAEKKGIKYDPMARHCIYVKDLEDMAKDENVEFKPGDILIVRTGFMKWYNEHSEEERIARVTNGSEYAGVEGNEETVTWLWNHHFAAVAGDSSCWEAWPPNPLWRIHDYQLALWGSPIGELWNIEQLAQECKDQNRWSFFFTSAPLNNKGGIATPPNALAIF